jgi:hypothetical protein
MGIKITVICFNCGTKNVVDVEPILTSGKIPISFVCQECGAMNEVSVDPQNLTDTEQDWLCLPKRGFEWVLPTGKISSIVGDTIYISAVGEYLSRQSYLEKYKVDPEIAYQYMRKKRSTQTTNKLTNNPRKIVGSKPAQDITGIKKIEIICKKCKRVCELNL